MTLEFQPFPKIARLNRDITITEKLDGTNAAVVIVPTLSLDHTVDQSFDGTIHDVILHDANEVARVTTDDGNENGEYIDYSLFAQSRSRLITPGKSTDNYGFAAWVRDNAEALVATLGEGTHYGEWWGSGIQSSYGLTGGDKRFSLFNTKRWPLPEGDDGGHLDAAIPGLGVVPVIYEGLYDDYEIEKALDRLKDHGSIAAPRFMRPEGIVIYHHASRNLFKVTLEGDEAPKGIPAHALDEVAA